MPAPPAPPSLAAERELGASLGVAAGGGASPGGLRLVLDYLHQLSSADWFDGGVAFTFGAGAAGCFRDRYDEVSCDHGPLDGLATDLFAGVRRFGLGRTVEDVAFAPWVRVALVGRLVRFPGDDLTGAGGLVQVAGGVRARLNPWLAVGWVAAAEAGVVAMTGRAGAQPQRGLVVGASVEFGLR